MPVVESVFMQVKGNVAVSAFSLLGLAMSEDPGEAVAEMLFYRNNNIQRY